LKLTVTTLKMIKTLFIWYLCWNRYLKDEMDILF